MYNTRMVTAEQGTMQIGLIAMHRTLIDDTSTSLSSPELLTNELQRGYEVSLTQVRDALKTLHEDGFLVERVGVPGIAISYGLTAKGVNEAKRLTGK